MHPDIAGMSNQAPEVDIAEVRSGIDELFGRLFTSDDGVEIRILAEYWGKAKASRPEGFRTFGASHWFKGNKPFGECAEFIAGINRVPGENVYFGVNPRFAVRKEDGTEEPLGGCKRHVSRVGALHADIDGFDPDRALETAARMDLDPVLVGSGAGSHGYLLLQEPIEIKTPADVEFAERLVRRFGLAFGQKIDEEGSDHTHDISRILRVPGLVNWPDSKKRRKGRAPSLCRLAHVTDRRYSLDELDAILPAFPDGLDWPLQAVEETETAAGAVPDIFCDGPRPPELASYQIPQVDSVQVEEALNKTSSGERMEKMQANLRNIIRKYYDDKPDRYWNGQSPTGERARRLIHLAWKFAIDLKVFLTWARSEGSGILDDSGYWACYQRRYFSPPFPPCGYGLVNRTGIYLVQGGRICRIHREKSGDTIIPLCNFDARIASATVRDDGVVRSTNLAIEGTLDSGKALGRVEVPVDQFAALSWTMQLGHGKGVVYAGHGARDHLRAAIQTLSGDYPERHVYAHTGWRKGDDKWVYLHAGGAIGEMGLVAGIDVAVPDALGRYELPAPQDGEVMQNAIRTSLGLLDDLVPDEIAFPLYCSVWRAVLGPCDHSTFLLGRTGTYKSELSALALRHFGDGLDARHLPASWSSTANALEGLAFAAKDVLLVVDDFAPGGCSVDVARQHREADRIFRAQGNSQGRQRMRADASLRAEKPPRGLIMATGEDAPRGHSVRARLMVVEVSPGDVDVGRLTRCQQEAKSYSTAMAGFVRWLAPRYDEFSARLPDRIAALRADCAGVHARTPGVAASLLVGLETFLQFATASGVIGDADLAALGDRGRKALALASNLQAEHQQDADPAERFVRLVGGLLTSGRAHLREVGGSRPASADRLGWRERTVNEDTVWEPQGRLIGWVEDETGIAYLEPESSFAEAQRMAADQGTALPVGPRTMHKRLKERGLLARTDDGRGKILVRKVVSDETRSLLALKNDALRNFE